MTRTYLPNSFQTPNALVDELMPLLTGDEWKVLSYMTRHILGFQDRIGERRHTMSLTMFQKGYDKYPGCGLGQNAIRACLEALTKFGIIKPIDKPTSKGQLWELAFDSPEIDFDGLHERMEQSSKSGKARTAAARSVRHNPSDGHKGYVGHKATVMSDITPGVLSDINKQTQYSNTPSNTEIQEKTAPVGANHQNKPAKKLRLPDHLKSWEWRHLEQFACDNPQIELLAAFEEKSKLKNLPTAGVARDAVELYRELTRQKVPVERWQSLHEAGIRIKNDASIFKRMLWALPNWFKAEQNIPIVTAPIIQSDGTPEPAHPAIIYGADGKPMTWEEFQNGKLQKPA